MKYALYVRKIGFKAFSRVSETVKNRKGLLTSKPVVFNSLEEVEAKANRYHELGYETKIKEIA